MLFHAHKVTPADADDLLTTINEAHRFKLSLGDTAWETQPFTPQDITGILARDNCYVVTLDGQPAGSVVLIWEDAHNWGGKGADGQAGYIHQLAVRDAFRGQNLGAQILDWACQQVRQVGRTYARLDCPANNTKLCAYYENRGFHRVSTSSKGAALYERPVASAVTSITTIGERQ